MNSLFTIEEAQIREADVLLCEWGNNYCCLAGYDPASKTIAGIQYFNVADPAANETIGEMKSLLEQYVNGKKVVFSFAFPEFLLAPAKFSRSGKELLSAVFDQGGNAFRDEINDWQVVNHYFLPANIERFISSSYANARMVHFFTPVIRNSNTFPDAIFIDINPQYMRLLVKRSGQLQLAQTYRYSQPLDVIYYLLKIETELGMDKEHTHILLSGLVEEQSALYHEIRQYFRNVSFRTGSVALPSSGLPEHFFTSISLLASCVS